MTMFVDYLFDFSKWISIRIHSTPFTSPESAANPILLVKSFIFPYFNPTFEAFSIRILTQDY